MKNMPVTSVPEIFSGADIFSSAKPDESERDLRWVFTEGSDSDLWWPRALPCISDFLVASALTVVGWATVRGWATGALSALASEATRRSTASLSALLDGALLKGLVSLASSAPRMASADEPSLLTRLLMFGWLLEPAADATGTTRCCAGFSVDSKCSVPSAATASVQALPPSGISSQNLRCHRRVQCFLKVFWDRNGLSNLSNGVSKKK